ncbi:hypothetical protein DB30_00102 [Enhygromyxa salina]|uniref:Uncharacterized protein n=1 Tax=Enhygromyxa salina TaxID=215803 RepID=A0A0C2A7M6_9BACT|nr:hypothetical protein DB30_00102 [Enhygromyxa salina]
MNWTRVRVMHLWALVQSVCPTLHGLPDRSRAAAERVLATTQRRLRDAAANAWRWCDKSSARALSSARARAPRPLADAFVDRFTLGIELSWIWIARLKPPPTWITCSS